MPFNFTSELIDKAFSYDQYHLFINDGLSQQPVNEAAAKMLPHIKRNAEVMQELDTTCKAGEQLIATLQAVPPATWLVITEPWCGDAAYNVPMMAAIEKAVPGKVKLCFLMRDSNLDIMDAHLTNGGRSIPKLIVLSKELKELGVWGPRPAGLELLMKGWKSEGLQIKELIPKIDQWYTEDKTESLQNELGSLIKSYS